MRGGVGGGRSLADGRMPRGACRGRQGDGPGRAGSGRRVGQRPPGWSGPFPEAQVLLLEAPPARARRPPPSAPPPASLAPPHAGSTPAACLWLRPSLAPPLAAQPLSVLVPSGRPRPDATPAPPTCSVRAPRSGGHAGRGPRMRACACVSVSVCVSLDKRMGPTACGGPSSGPALRDPWRSHRLTLLGHQRWRSGRRRCSLGSQPVGGGRLQSSSHAVAATLLWAGSVPWAREAGALR